MSLPLQRKFAKVLSIRELPSENYTGVVENITSGWQTYFVNGIIHREDGPAIIHPEHPDAGAWMLCGFELRTQENHSTAINIWKTMDIGSCYHIKGHGIICFELDKSCFTGKFLCDDRFINLVEFFRLIFWDSAIPS